MPYGSIWNYSLPKKYIYPLSRHVFEGYDLVVPGNAESYLEVLYEDWKELPNDVQTHHVDVIFKQSFAQVIGFAYYCFER